MAGTDRIESIVRVLDSQGQIVGEFFIKSKNPTVSSAHGLLIDHAEKIVDALRGDL